MVWEAKRSPMTLGTRGGQGNPCVLTEEGRGCRWGYFLLNRPPGGETEAAAGMGAMYGGRPHLYPLQSHECP